MTIYEKIVEECRAQNITIAELERKAGLSNGTVGKWASAPEGIRLKSISLIAKALDVPIINFIEEQ